MSFAAKINAEGLNRRGALAPPADRGKSPVRPIRLAVCLAAFLAAFVALFPAVPASFAGEGVNWLSYEEGMAKAREENKPVLLFFHLPYCYRCKNMKRTTYVDQEVITRLNRDFIPVMIDMDKEKGLVEKYKADYVPTHVLLASDGAVVARQKDQMSKDVFMAFLDRASASRGK